LSFLVPYSLNSQGSWADASGRHEAQEGGFMMTTWKLMRMTWAGNCVVAVACLAVLGMLTSCGGGNGGEREPSTELSEGMQFVTELTDEQGTVLFRRRSTVYNIAPSEESDDLFVLLHEAPEINIDDMVSAEPPLTKDELLAFVREIWPGGDVDSFHEALRDFDVNPVDLVKMINESAMAPADVVDLIESIDNAFDDSIAGSDPLAFFYWLSDNAKTLADFVTAIEAVGHDTDGFLLHLSDMGLHPHILRDMYAAYVDTLDPAERDNAFETFIELLSFTKSRQELKRYLPVTRQAADIAGAVIEVGKFAYDVLKNSQGVTTSDDVTMYLNEDDTNWANYSRGALVEGKYHWKVYEDLIFDKVKVVDITFKMIVYYNKLHNTVPGQYVSTAVVVDSVWVGMVSSVDASVSMDKPTNIGTTENPIPQGFGKIIMSSKYLGIPEQNNIASFTVYGDQVWSWGNNPR
jgi:hypothetical protein